MADIGGKEGLAARKSLARRLTPVIIGIIIGIIISAKVPSLSERVNIMLGGDSEQKAACVCSDDCSCDCGCHGEGDCGCEECVCDCGCDA
tara:strand:- start:2049 stop:2318 length:270 start_codon:yes stop_codon:yes gene_type:complete